MRKIAQHGESIATDLKLPSPVSYEWFFSNFNPWTKHKFKMNERALAPVAAAWIEWESAVVYIRDIASATTRGS